MYNEYPFHGQTSLRHKLKSSICCFSGTIHAHPHGFEDYGDSSYDKLNPLRTPRTPISPATWLKRSAIELGDSHRGGRGRHFMSRMGLKHHRLSQSADFTYDPSSYALNFDDDSRAGNDEFPFRGFASRLPASPPLPSQKPDNYKEEPPVTVTREIVGYS